MNKMYQENKDKQQDHDRTCCAFCKSEAVVIAKLPSVRFLKPTLPTPLCLLHCYTSTSTAVRCSKTHMSVMKNGRKELDRQLPIVRDALLRACKRFRDDNATMLSEESASSLEEDLYALVNNLCASKSSKLRFPAKLSKVKKNASTEEKTRVVPTQPKEIKKNSFKSIRLYNHTASPFSSKSIQITPETTSCKTVLPQHAFSKMDCRLPIVSAKASPISTVPKGTWDSSTSAF